MADLEPRLSIVSGRVSRQILVPISLQACLLSRVSDERRRLQSQFMFVRFPETIGQVTENLACNGQCASSIRKVESRPAKGIEFDPAWMAPFVPALPCMDVRTLEPGVHVALGLRQSRFLPQGWRRPNQRNDRRHVALVRRKVRRKVHSDPPPAERASMSAPASAGPVSMSECRFPRQRSTAALPAAAPVSSVPAIRIVARQPRKPARPRFRLVTRSGSCSIWMNTGRRIPGARNGFPWGVESWFFAIQGRDIRKPMRGVE